MGEIGDGGQPWDGKVHELGKMSSAQEELVDLMCDENTGPALMRDLVAESGRLAAYHHKKITFPRADADHESDLALQERTIVVPVASAGDFMQPGVSHVFGLSSIYKVGIERIDEMPHVYFNTMEGRPNYGQTHAIIVDPMLATGGTANQAIDLAYEFQVQTVSLLCILAAPEGLTAVHNAWPDTDIFTLKIAEGLDENAYIIGPYMGDCGDRCQNRPHKVHKAKGVGLL